MLIFFSFETFWIRLVDICNRYDAWAHLKVNILVKNENIGMIKRLEVYAEQSEANNFQNM